MLLSFVGVWLWARYLWFVPFVAVEAGGKGIEDVLVGGNVGVVRVYVAPRCTAEVWV